MGMKIILTIKKNFAFTLAEVLITLGIIGVVAALTIPALMNKTNDLELKTAWKKTYSTLNQAAISMFLNYDDYTISTNVSAHDGVLNAMSKYLSYSKYCSYEGAHQGECFHKSTSFKLLNGNTNPGGPGSNGTFTPWQDQGSTIILSNGALLWGMDWNSGHPPSNPALIGRMAVDVNGFKGPNMVGKDIFGLFIDKSRNSAIAFGIPGYTSSYLDFSLPTTCNGSADTSAGNTGGGCAAMFLYQ